LDLRFSCAAQPGCEDYGWLFQQLEKTSAVVSADEPKFPQRLPSRRAVVRHLYGCYD